MACLARPPCEAGHVLGLYRLNNGFIVQTMLPFHKCGRIYEIKSSVPRLPALPACRGRRGRPNLARLAKLVGQVSEIRVRDFF